jgi:hypothetical protein
MASRTSSSLVWIVLAPWLLSGATEISQWIDLFIGVLVVALSIRRGLIEESFDSCNRYLIELIHGEPIGPSAFLT